MVLLSSPICDFGRKMPEFKLKGLDDNFFDRFEEIEKVATELKENVLSTHYFISRILHDLALSANDANFTRNSMFVNFFDQALPAGIGNFSPWKCLVFQKKFI